VIFIRMAWSMWCSAEIVARPHSCHSSTPKAYTSPARLGAPPCSVSGGRCAACSHISRRTVSQAHLGFKADHVPGRCTVCLLQQPPHAKTVASLSTQLTSMADTEQVSMFSAAVKTM
jgi:hypothetical protein